MIFEKDLPRDRRSRGLFQKHHLDEAYQSFLRWSSDLKLPTGGNHHVNLAAETEGGEIEAGLDGERGAGAQQPNIVRFEVVDVHAIAVRAVPADGVTRAMRECSTVAGGDDNRAGHAIHLATLDGF